MDQQQRQLYQAAATDLFQMQSFCLIESARGIGKTTLLAQRIIQDAEMHIFRQEPATAIVFARNAGPTAHLESVFASALSEKQHLNHVTYVDVNGNRWTEMVNNYGATTRVCFMLDIEAVRRHSVQPADGNVWLYTDETAFIEAQHLAELVSRFCITKWRAVSSVGPVDSPVKRLVRDEMPFVNRHVYMM
jgi:hypothetical protein